jgi:putative ABC transport system substrate-binding protein
MDGPDESRSDAPRRADERRSRNHGDHAAARDVRSAAKLEGAFAAALEQRMEALFLYPLPIAPPDRQRIVQFGIKNRLPTVAISPHYVEEGMLVAYGVSGPDLYRRAGGYVDKILRGVKPADLPVEQPTKFELVINLKTAKAL